MLLLLSAVIIGGGVVWSGLRIVGELKRAREEAARGRTLQVLAAFSPAVAAAQSDPRAMLTWAPLARSARAIAPAEFAAIEGASGAAFPFGDAQVQAAHAQWSADWLAWERTHDAEYKLKAAMVERELDASGGSPAVRARLDAVEGEKLDLYQRRYAEYVRVAKALQALSKTP
jgi:hypothetical protein